MFVFETIILAYETYGNDRDGGACAHHPNRGSHSMSSGILYLYNCAFKPKNMYQFFICIFIYIYIYIASHLLALFPKIGSMKKCSVFFRTFLKIMLHQRGVNCTLSSNWLQPVHLINTKPPAGRSFTEAGDEQRMYIPLRTSAMNDECALVVYTFAMPRR